MRRTEGYAWADLKTNKSMFNDLNVRLVIEKKLQI